MRITKLEITNYKNLDAKLSHNSDIIALIGNNGSGKSNLLEAVSHIFRSLYMPKYNINFDYCIEYETSKKSIIKIEKEGKSKNYFLNNISVKDISGYLPQKVVAIYSGEENRLFDDCFGPSYLEFVNNINKAQIQGTEYSELPKMLFLNKFYWSISLLSLLVSNSEDNSKFIKDVLKINQIDKIKIDFVKKNYEKYNDNKALRLVRDIDIKAEYDLEDFKNILLEKGHIADDLYKYLYLAYSPKDSKIINDIIIEFNGQLTVADLSEGEKKLLLIKGALEFAGQEDSIFILDEPDSHIHISNKEQITKSFAPYQHNRQIIITTHSPTLTQCMKDENVYMLNRGKIEDKKRQEIIQDVAGEFWNKHQQNSFLSSKKNIILLVEGKHDKMHLINAYDKLKEEYPTLDFDIFSLGGEGKIHPFMNGLYEANIKNEVIYIGIFDSDSAGEKSFKNGFLPINNEEFRKLKEDKIKHNNFFAFTLIKPTGFNKECTIENMFDSVEYEKAYKEALDKSIGNFSNKSIEDININLKESSKNILSENSKTFQKEDFKNFRALFNLILKINNYTLIPTNKIVEEVKGVLVEEIQSGGLDNIIEEIIEVKEQEEKTNEGSRREIILPTGTKPLVIFKDLKNKRSGSSKSEGQHLKGKQAPIKRMYQQLKKEILERDNSIDFDSKVEYIAFKKGNKNIFDIKVQNLKLIIWVNKKKGDIPTPYNELFEDCSGKGHHGNGDYERHIKTEDELTEFINTGIIQKIIYGTYYE